MMTSINNCKAKLHEAVSRIYTYKSQVDEDEKDTEGRCCDWPVGQPAGLSTGVDACERRAEAGRVESRRATKTLKPAEAEADGRYKQIRVLRAHDMMRACRRRRRQTSLDLTRREHRRRVFDAAVGVTPHRARVSSSLLLSQQQQRRRRRLVATDDHLSSSFLSTHTPQQ